MGAALYSVKPYVLLLYGAFGLACLWAPGPHRHNVVSRAIDASRGRSIGLLLVLIAAALLLFVYVAVDSFLLLDAALISAIIFLLQPSSWRTSNTVVGGVSAALIVLSMVWWRIEPSTAKWLPLAAFAFILGMLVMGLSDPKRFHSLPILLPLLLFVVGGLGLLFDLGAFRVGQSAIAFLVHHWGAFIGPALHVRAGLVPFVDVPLQYGLGPTLAIAAACKGSDCWSGAEIIFVLTHLVGALLVLMMALRTETRRGAAWVCAVTVIVFAAVVLWPGFPSEGSLLMATPSSGGVRFLPVTIVACLWFFGRARAATVAAVPAILWSPESAAMTIAVFGLCATAQVGFRKAALISAALLVGSYAALFLVHRLIFGLWIDPLALIEYVLHVPGPLPLNPFSDVLLLAATLGLGGWLVFNPSGDPQTQRRDLAVTALLFATSSYMLGRSHPNNVCNLAPFLVLVGLRALDRRTKESGVVEMATAFGLAVSAAALAFSPWTIVPFDPHVVTDVQEILAGFPAQEPDLMRIRAQIPKLPALGIADFGPQFARHPAETIVWTPMDPSSLWSYVPSERRKIYIERSAARLRRSGWAIFAGFSLFLLDDLKTAYDVRDERTLDGGPTRPGGSPTRYTVVCLDPKPQFAASKIGPACPTSDLDSFKAASTP